MAIFDEVTHKFTCECGCGEEVEYPFRDWKPGHWNRTDESRRKISEAHSGMCYLLDEGVSERRSEAQRRSYLEDPTRADRVSESNSGKLQFLNKEYCQHQSEAARQAYLDDPTLAIRHGQALSGLVRDSKAIENSSRGHYEFYSSKEGEEWRERMSRENSPNWKGGLRGRYGYGWDAISELIKARDHRTCQSCGTKFNLVVHHIDNVPYNMNERNLITVCGSCNRRAASKLQEQYWVDFYTKKIQEIYREVS